jgi:hypothetical protein
MICYLRESVCAAVGKTKKPQAYLWLKKKKATGLKHLWPKKFRK